MRVWRIWAERRTACVPTKVMQLVAKIWQFHLADALAVRGRLRIDVNNEQRVVQLAAGRI